MAPGEYGFTTFPEKHWKRHRHVCDLNFASLNIRRRDDKDGEPPLQRHLRHWTARFDDSLTLAAVVGMGINRSFSNVDKYGMIVHLTPRPHSVVGARFSLESCSIVPINEFQPVVTIYGPYQVMNQHERERKLSRERTNGMQDFVACLVIANNEGRYKLDGDHVHEARFKPLAVRRDMVGSPQLADPTIAWLPTLKYQVEQDDPARSMT